MRSLMLVLPNVMSQRLCFTCPISLSALVLFCSWVAVVQLHLLKLAARET